MNQIRHGQDATLERNNYRYWKHLIQEYQAVKAKSHPRFKFTADFYKSYNIKRQNFIKYYNRFKNDPGNNASLQPQKRGPKYKRKLTPSFIEDQVIQLRQQGLNRYEIFAILKPKYKQFTPCPTRIYELSKKHHLNRLSVKQMEQKRKIIKQKSGELAHIDCHYLPKELIAGSSKRYYLVGILDDASRVTWCEVVSDIKSLSVMFASLKILNLLKLEYNIEFAEILSDNGSEFGRRSSKESHHHPFMRLCAELGIKQRYTRPYRPQTNGKIERFWRTIHQDFIDDSVFDSIEHFKDQLLEYLVYYNQARPHSSLNGKTPASWNNFCHRNT